MERLGAPTTEGRGGSGDREIGEYTVPASRRKTQMKQHTGQGKRKDKETPAESLETLDPS
jgi:hypothetical protein